MKYFHQLFSFTICASLLMGSPAVYAEDALRGNKTKAPVKYTEHAYNPNDFCGENGAEKAMKELEAVNAEKFKQIAIYKEEIIALTESDKLVAATRDIKIRYMNSLAEIAKEERPGILTRAKEVGQIALDNLAKKLKLAQVTKADATVLTTVSEKAKLSTESTSPIVNEATGQYSLAKASMPLELSKDLQRKVNGVVAEIPEEVSTEKILEIYKSGSPTFNKLLDNKFTEKEILACIEENITQDACAKVGITPEEKPNLLEKISADLKNISTQISNRYRIANPDSVTGAGVLTPGEINRRRKVEEIKAQEVVNTNVVMKETLKDLDKLTVLDSAKKSTEANGRQRNLNRSMDDKAKDLMARNEKKLVGIENFFYDPMTDEKLKALGIDITTKEGATEAIKKQEEALTNATENARIYKEECSFSDASKASIPTDQINRCHGLVSKIIPKLNNIRDSHINRVSELNFKIQKLAGEDNFADTENLKKYIAEKYMCSCKNENKKNISVNQRSESLILTGEACSAQFLTLSKIEGLSDASSAIANALYAHEIKSPTDGESCAMTPQRLKPFSDTCRQENTFITSKFPSVCEMVNNEYVEKVQVHERVAKQDAKWEKYNEENYVEYNSKSPTGYTAVKKKSTWRVVGEGVLPVLPNAVPIWLGNYQMKNNIDMLTDQAMLQKQYLHNVDIYNQSPWLYNYNYFGYGNPFMQTTTGTGTTLGGSSGFNFGI